MPPPSAVSFQQSLVALAALGLIVLLCRWVFSAAPRGRPPSSPPADRSVDLGLLEVVTAVRTSEDAQMLRAVLRDAGIRASVTLSEEGYAVLVFRADASRARALVRS